MKGAGVSFTIRYDFLEFYGVFFCYFDILSVTKGDTWLWDIFVGTVYSLGYSSGMNQLIQQSF